MTTLILTITILPLRPASRSLNPSLQEVAETLMAQCLPRYISQSHWDQSLFYFHPDEEAECHGVEYRGMELKLVRTFQSPYRAMLAAQIIQNVALLFGNLYEGKYDITFRIDKIS